MKVSKVILIIDDDLSVIEALKNQLFKVFGSEFSYEFASSGEEGLEIIDELLSEGVNILVTISDWLMPGMKGDEFLVRLHQIAPETIKIMLTGHASQESIQRAYKEANLFKALNKPWNETELIDTIKNSLKKS
jgi:DNA-binding NtrC family response regulator